MNWSRKILALLPRRECKHVVYFMETLERRPDGQVEAVCDKCGLTLVADYGLVLPAQLRQREKHA